MQRTLINIKKKKPVTSRDPQYIKDLRSLLSYSSWGWFHFLIFASSPSGPHILPFFDCHRKKNRGTAQSNIGRSGQARLSLMSFSRFPFSSLFFIIFISYYILPYINLNDESLGLCIDYYILPTIDYIVSCAVDNKFPYIPYLTEILINRKHSLCCVGRRDCSHMELLTWVSTRDDSSPCFQVDDDPFSSVGRTIIVYRGHL